MYLDPRSAFGEVTVVGLSGALKSGIQVFDEVAKVLKADRNADEPRRDSHGFADVRGHRCMGHGGWVFN
jgi:hypothetical protein